MCWYTDFLFVIFIKYDFKYLLSLFTQYSQKQDNLKLKINYIDISPDFTLIKHD
jgi:hypothetical protein